MTDDRSTGHRLRHTPALDGLRAVAIGGVVVSHVGVPHLLGGALGVEVFFVLSGFLITTLLLQERERTGRIDLLRFSARRVLRLFPALLLVLLVWAVYLATHHAVPQRQETIDGLLPSLLYYANWSRFVDGYAALGWLAPMWSLSVEEQFYLLWPVSLLLLSRSRLSRRIPGVLVAGCLLVIAFRVNDLWSLDQVYRRFGTHEIADQLLIGCLLAFLLERGGPLVLARAKRWCGRLVPLAVGFLVVVVVTLDDRPSLAYHRFLYSIGLTLIALSTAVVIGHIMLSPQSRVVAVLGARPLPWLGTISYGIYLWHTLVLLLAMTHQVHATAELLVVVSAGSVAVAALSFYAWERPFLRVKARLRPRVPSPAEA